MDEELKRIYELADGNKDILTLLLQYEDGLIYLGELINRTERIIQGRD